eukprot:5630145-Alexandrium_andersonii.AAC.1
MAALLGRASGGPGSRLSLAPGRKIGDARDPGSSAPHERPTHDDGALSLPPTLQPHRLLHQVRRQVPRRPDVPPHTICVHRAHQPRVLQPMRLAIHGRGHSQAQ